MEWIPGGLAVRFTRCQLPRAFYIHKCKCQLCLNGSWALPPSPSPLLRLLDHRGLVRGDDPTFKACHGYHFPHCLPNWVWGQLSFMASFYGRRVYFTDAGVPINMHPLSTVAFSSSGAPNINAKHSILAKIKYGEIINFQRERKGWDMEEEGWKNYWLNAFSFRHNIRRTIVFNTNKPH